MTDRAARQVGFMLVTTAPFRVRCRPGLLWQGTGHKTPSGNRAAAPVRDERIERMARRAAARLPLFDDGPAVPDPHPRACWGCGTPPAGVQSNGARLPVGWASRVFAAAGGRSTETYCPECAPLADLEDTK